MSQKNKEKQVQSVFILLIEVMVCACSRKLKLHMFLKATGFHSFMHSVILSSFSLSLSFFAFLSHRKLQPEINTGELASYFIKQFNNNVFCNGQQVGI